VVDPRGIVTAFGLAETASDERPIADALIASDRCDAYLADKGFTGVEWERRWLGEYGALGRPHRRTTPAGHGREGRPPLG
jgi:hypothetical protein